MNKLGRLVDTESVLNRLRYNALKGISYKFSIDGKEYDLMEGVDSLPDFTENKPDQLNQLFEVEQAIHDNFQKALADSGKTAEELFEDGTFFQSIIHSPTDIKLQKVSLLQKNMTEISDFDKALYVLSLLSDNPSDYFRSVKNQIELNSRLAEEKQIAPLTVQQNLSRLAEAAHSKTYKAGFKALAQQYKTQRTITPNIVHIDGTAGAGKTEVVLKAVRQRFKDEDALVIGPTIS
jgi:primosomal protein N'